MTLAAGAEALGGETCLSVLKEVF
ncbi:MAG: hypothetical protein RI959_1188, partial [Pseudomonadota bacterium]